VFEDILNDPKTNPEIFKMYNEEKKGDEENPENAGDTVNPGKTRTGLFDSNLISNTSFVKLREVLLKSNFLAFCNS